MSKVIEFRAIRRGINRPIKARTAGYHQEILGITKKLFPDRALASFDAVGLLKGIQESGYGQSRRKAIFELLKRTFADAVRGRRPLKSFYEPCVQPYNLCYSREGNNILDTPV